MGRRKIARLGGVHYATCEASFEAKASDESRTGGLLSLTGGASAATGGPAVDMPTMPNSAAGHEITLGEEEISDVSLATFYVFDKEKQRLQMRLERLWRLWRLRRLLRVLGALQLVLVGNTFRLR